MELVAEDVEATLLVGDDRAQPLVHRELVVTHLVEDGLQHDHVRKRRPLEQIDLVQHHVRVEHVVALRALGELGLQVGSVELWRAGGQVVAQIRLAHVRLDRAAPRALEEDPVRRGGVLHVGLWPRVPRAPGQVVWNSRTGKSVSQSVISRSRRRRRGGAPGRVNVNVCLLRYTNSATEQSRGQ